MAAPDRTAVVSLRVVDDSMEPTLYAGAMVFVEPVGDIRQPDAAVVCYGTRNGDCILKRLWVDVPQCYFCSDNPMCRPLAVHWTETAEGRVRPAGAACYSLS